MKRLLDSGEASDSRKSKGDFPLLSLQSLSLKICSRRFRGGLWEGVKGGAGERRRKEEFVRVSPLPPFSSQKPPLDQRAFDQQKDTIGCNPIINNNSIPTKLHTPKFCRVPMKTTSPWPSLIQLSCQKANRWSPRCISLYLMCCQTQCTTHKLSATTKDRQKPSLWFWLSFTSVGPSYGCQ